MNSALAILQVSGSDAKKFLQGQLTYDIEKVSSQPALAAHCNPQGRIISLFYLLQEENIYYLVLPETMLLIAQNFLKKFAVFFKVELSVATINEKYLSLIPWQQRIQHNIPMIYPETSAKFLPHEINLQHLNALSFDKGCYTGQEIIARMHYRGKLKNHLYRMQMAKDVPLAPGLDIYLGERIVGNVVDYMATQKESLCLITTDETSAQSGQLFLASHKESYFAPYALAL